MSLTETLPVETIRKLIGSSIKIGPGRTTNGKEKGGPTIGKFVRLEGNKAIVIPKGHKREEAIPLDRVCIWKKGLSLNHKTDREIAEILGEEVTPVQTTTPEEPAVTKRKPEVEGVFVIKHSDGTYYVKASHDVEQSWSIYLDDATVYDTQGGGRRALSRRANSDDSFKSCAVVDAELETAIPKPVEAAKPAPAAPAPESVIEQMAALCTSHKSAKERLASLKQARATLDAQIDQAAAAVETAAEDIRAAAELMVGE